jgi:hypothetical protein
MNGPIVWTKVGSGYDIEHVATVDGKKIASAYKGGVAGYPWSCSMPGSKIFPAHTLGNIKEQVALAWERRFFAPDALEVSLSKSDAAHRTVEQNAAFNRDLSTWAESMATKGYTIVPDPDAGPGTMYWRAKR